MCYISNFYESEDRKVNADYISKKMWWWTPDYFLTEQFTVAFQLQVEL